MAENVNFSKKVYDKKSYTKTIDTLFKELGVESIEEAALPTLPSVQEFFDMYNTLFYQINELGPTNSHQSLIKRSSDYIGTQEDNDLVILLQAEIANLRKQLLTSQKQLADFVVNIDIPEAPKIEIPEPEPIPEPVIPVTPPTPPTPDPPPTDEEIVISDFKRFSKSSNGDRAERLGLTKTYIKGIKKANNL